MYEPVELTNDATQRNKRSKIPLKPNPNMSQQKKEKRFTDFCTLVKPKITVDMHSAFRTSCFRKNFKDGWTFHLNRVAHSGKCWSQEGPRITYKYYYMLICIRMYNTNKDFHWFVDYALYCANYIYIYIHAYIVYTTQVNSAFGAR